MRKLILSSFLLAGAMAIAPMATAQVNYGNNSSTWANDGECDDPRFEGPGMTATALLDEDIRADATDCRTAFEAGLLTLRGEGLPDLK